MPHNRSLTLAVASKQNTAMPVRMLFLLALLSALLGPQPVISTAVVIVVAGVGWIIRILCISNVTEVELYLVLFADGRVSLGSNGEDAVEGFLAGQQWCTQRVAVLRVAIAGKVQNLLVLSRQQGAEEYRRLNVWLRQGVLQLNSEGRVQS